VGCDVFDRVTVFGFDRDKAIGDQAAEVEGDLRTVTIRHGHRAAILTGPICFTRLLKRREKFTRCRDADGIASNCLGKLISRETSDFRAGGHKNDAHQADRTQSLQTNHWSDYPRPSRNYQREYRSQERSSIIAISLVFTWDNLLSTVRSVAA